VRGEPHLGLAREVDEEQVIIAALRVLLSTERGPSPVISDSPPTPPTLATSVLVPDRTSTR
jgi:hypothetical protein